MHNWLRITLLALCTGVGIAVALAVALHQPAKSVAARAESAAHPASGPAPATATPTSTVTAAIVPAEPQPIVAPYRDTVARQVGQLEESIQQLEESSHRRDRSMLRAIAAIQDRIDEGPRRPAADDRPAEAEQQPAEPIPEVAPPLQPAGPSVVAESRTDVRRGEGDDSLIINLQNADLRVVLETISRETGLNIIASKGVNGTVTATLNGVDYETALSAILKSTGFVAAREGNIIYIGTPADLQLMNQFQDRLVTRIYRPNYAKAADLQLLFTPLLSTDGKITVNTPSQIDIPADQTKTGGNGFAGLDTVVVRDYETVLRQIDDIFAEVDSKPRQVAIEAMIVRVELNDTFKLGVNFSALKDHSNVQLISGNPAVSLGSVSLTDGGLHFGFLDGSLTSFISALEKIGDTDVVASPRLTCLNKQRAEIQIGQELGYVSTTVTPTSSTQTINFLSIGTILRIRPFIGDDGLIRLEVHPELSTGTVTIQGNFSLPNKTVTQVTTNVLCPDGCTAVIGGLIREDLTDSTSGLPFLGSAPYIGWLFRQKVQTIDRSEIIVLITPRIVSEPFMCKEGIALGNEFTQRQNVYFDKMSPIGRRNIARHHLRMSRAAYNAGDFDVAMKQVNLAIHYDPQNRDSINLRNDIVAAGGFHDESIHEYLHRGLAPLSGRHVDYSRDGYPWKEYEGMNPPAVSSTNDMGIVGRTRTIVRPPPQPNNLFDPDGPPALRTPPRTEPLPPPTVREALPPPPMTMPPGAFER
jgi:type IV pilus assembly protein PilQ